MYDSWKNWKPTNSSASTSNKGDQITLITGVTSVMKEDFQPLKVEKAPIGKRKQLMKQFFMEYLLAELAEKLTKPDKEEIAEMTSEYMRGFSSSTFKSCDPLETADPKLMEKYPLYRDMAKSIYLERITKIKSNFVSKDPSAVFKKCSYFSKPFYSELE